MMKTISDASSSSSKRMRDVHATGVNAALMHAVLSRLPHRAASGHVLRGWQKVAESVAIDAGEGGDLLTAEMCKRRYVQLVTAAQHDSVECWPVDLQELLTAALVEETQWKVETGISDPNSVARHTRLAVSGVKQEIAKAGVAKAQKQRSSTPMETKLEHVVARLDEMEGVWRQRVKEERVKREKDMKELKETVFAALDESQQKLLEIQEKQKIDQEKKNDDVKDLKDECDKREERLTELKHTVLAALKAINEKTAEDSATISTASLLPITQTHRQLQQDVRLLQAEAKNAREDRTHGHQQVAVLRTELQRERDERQQQVTVIRRSNDWALATMQIELTKLQKALEMQQVVWMRSKVAGDVRRASLQREIIENVRHELKQRDDLFASMQSVLENYATQRDVQDRHRKTAILNDQLKIKEHQAAVHHRLAALEQELRSLRDQVAAMQEQPVLNQVELLREELTQLLDTERLERTSESNKLLRTIRRILTTTVDDETDSE